MNNHNTIKSAKETKHIKTTKNYYNNDQHEKNTTDIVDTLKHHIHNLEERMSLLYEEPTALYDSEDEDQAYGHHY